jgi:hypothetical protein
LHGQARRDGTWHADCALKSQAFPRRTIKTAFPRLDIGARNADHSIN